jgi:hypothetical protein
MSLTNDRQTQPISGSKIIKVELRKGLYSGSWPLSNADASGDEWAYACLREGPKGAALGLELRASAPPSAAPAEIVIQKGGKCVR